MKKSFLLFAVIFAAINFSALAEALGGTEKTVATEEKVWFTPIDAIPREYMAFVENGGRVEPITYETKDYAGDGGKITKYANVYLPAGYDGSKKYPVLYLMHGIGGSETEWGLVGDSSLIKKIAENLVIRDEAVPFIIVTPNGRSSRDFGNVNSNYNSFYKFGLELRNELIPYIDPFP